VFTFCSLVNKAITARLEGGGKECVSLFPCFEEVAEQRPQAVGYGPGAHGAAYRASGTAITLNQRA
jgi:hypothetical protein